MMRMPMRLDKSQVKTIFGDMLIFSTPGSFIFNKLPYVMAGYTNYELLLVGAAGGRGGSAYGNADATIIMYGFGGGGGGSLRVKGLLRELPVQSNLSVGGAGTPGANSATGTRNPAGDGLVGQPSTFNTHVAWGGAGGIGGDWNRDAPGGADAWVYVNTKGRGGDGGGNNAGLGGGGVGAVSSDVRIYDGTGSGSDTPGDGGTNPTTGTYVAGGVYPVIGGGKGGGGGKGQINEPSGVMWAGGSGADGSVSLAQAPGGLSFAVGGTGGGADLALVTGVTEYHGSGTLSSQDGAVAIHIS